ncbi:MAG: carboxylesterase/lipase family protein, partial [Methyloligellaceae bacterium]
MVLRNRLSTIAAAAALLVACQNVALNQAIPVSQPVAPQCSAPAVKTTNGTVCGVSVSGGKIHAYLGIPYAQSTAGLNRWSPPLPVAKSKATLKATSFGPVCPQAADKSPFPQSEDCLSLNVWTPQKKSGSGRPVMVFIHGGAFVFGSSANPLYNGSALAARGVVVVTLNYRLGALGFLAGIDGLTGNYGFLDQQLALKWVRDNIAAFGGDPGKVTIFGESAGAMSVGLHLQSPVSRRMFRAAIMESNPFGMPYKSMSEAGRFGGHFRSAVGCRSGGLDCLKRVPFATLVQHQKTFWIEIESLLSGFSGQLVWAPVVDGETVPAQANQNQISQPVIVGTNRDEGVIFANFGKGGFMATEQLYRIKYSAAIALLFSRTMAAKVRSHPSYRPVSGDNT